MPASHLRAWRIVGVLAVLAVWTGGIVDLAVGDFDWLDAVLAVVVPLLMWNALWNARAPLVANSRRRENRP